jgi:hypothetical protein
LRTEEPRCGWECGNAADLLAGLDILDLKVAIGNEADRLDTEDFAGPLRSLHQQAHVHDLVGHITVFSTIRFVLRINRNQNVVADADLRARGYRPAVETSQRYWSSPVRSSWASIV